MKHFAFNFAQVMLRYFEALFNGLTFSGQPIILGWAHFCVGPCNYKQHEGYKIPHFIKLSPSSTRWSCLILSHKGVFNDLGLQVSNSLKAASDTAGIL